MAVEDKSTELFSCTCMYIRVRVCTYLQLLMKLGTGSLTASAFIAGSTALIQASRKDAGQSKRMR